MSHEIIRMRCASLLTLTDFDTAISQATSSICAYVNNALEDFCASRISIEVFEDKKERAHRAIDLIEAQVQQ